jgi:hypothetical protein
MASIAFGIPLVVTPFKAAWQRSRKKPTPGMIRELARPSNTTAWCAKIFSPCVAGAIKRIETRGLAFNYRRHVAAYPFGRIHLAVPPKQNRQVALRQRRLHESGTTGFRGGRRGAPRVVCLACRRRNHDPAVSAGHRPRWKGTAFGGARGRTDVPKILDWYIGARSRSVR